MSIEISIRILIEALIEIFMLMENFDAKWLFYRAQLMRMAIIQRSNQMQVLD